MCLYTHIQEDEDAMDTGDKKEDHEINQEPTPVHDLLNSSVKDLTSTAASASNVYKHASKVKHTSKVKAKKVVHTKKSKRKH